MQYFEVQADLHWDKSQIHIRITPPICPLLLPPPSPFGRGLQWPTLTCALVPPSSTCAGGMAQPQGMATFHGQNGTQRGQSSSPWRPRFRLGRQKYCVRAIGATTLCLGGSGTVRRSTRSIRGYTFAPSGNCQPYWGGNRISSGTKISKSHESTQLPMLPQGTEAHGTYFKCLWICRGVGEYLHTRSKIKIHQRAISEPVFGKLNWEHESP